MLLLLMLVSVGLAAAQRRPSVQTAKIDAEGCGQRPLAKGPALMIVGGKEVDPKYSWPFICSLQSRTTSRHFCGGSLIKNLNGEYFFVTAAHCVSPGSHNSYQAVCSTHNVLTSEPYDQILTFSQVIRHSGYNANTLVNDIAILKLATQPKENDYLQPVCIPNSNYNNRELASVLGWGTTSSGGSASNVLLEASKPIVSDDDCARAYGSAFRPASMVCSGYLGVGGVDACQGDSGGPLVVYRNDAWELVGVVSWGYGCAAPTYPGVYADVYGLKTWINTQIN